MAEWVSSSRLSATTKRVWRYTRPAAVLIMHELKSVVKGEKEILWIHRTKAKKKITRWSEPLWSNNQMDLALEVRSRWKSPLEWKYLIPLAVSQAIFIRRFHGISSSLRISCSRLPPLMYCRCVMEKEKSIRKRHESQIQRNDSNQTRARGIGKEKEKGNDEMEGVEFSLSLCGWLVCELLPGRRSLRFKPVNYNHQKDTNVSGEKWRKNKKNQKEKETRSRTTSQTER